ncbi:MAG: hypothetical protein BRC28_00755 [Nanohaloarchaea archaeon SW_4_43_9]|nr:MAG: hypothetical protein BRC28_00755 [Nanohaloarchaea archaeon SW_4_43_9]
MSVKDAVQDGNNEARVTFQVQGDRELDDFTVIFASEDRGNVEQIRLDNANLTNADIETVRTDAPETGQPYSTVRIASEECPAEKTVDISLQCPGGFAGSDEEGGFCIMKYEASRSDATDSSEGSSTIAASQQGVVPWTNVDYPSARSACHAMGDGYNLSTNREWQAATEAVIGDSSTFVHGNNNFAQAVEDSSEKCAVDPTHSYDDRCLTGTGPSTWSTDSGVADLNGNVWERVYVTDASDGTVDKSHPMHFEGDAGFVNAWNSTGKYPTDLASSANSSFGDDDYYSSDNNDRAIWRGGLWDSGHESGPFSITLSQGPSASFETLGFRCSY